MIRALLILLGLGTLLYLGISVEQRRIPAEPVAATGDRNPEQHSGLTQQDLEWHHVDPDGDNSYRLQAAEATQADGQVRARDVELHFDSHPWLNRISAPSATYKQARQQLKLPDRFRAEGRDTVFRGADAVYSLDSGTFRSGSPFELRRDGLLLRGNQFELSRPQQRLLASGGIHVALNE